MIKLVFFLLKGFVIIFVEVPKRYPEWGCRRLNLLYKDESMCVCVRRPVAGPTQPITLKFGMGPSFHPGSAPSQGATANVDPWGYPLK